MLMLVFSLITALVKCERFHQFYEALQKFLAGFHASNADSNDRQNKVFATQWADTVLVQFLSAQHAFYEADYRLLVHVIDECSGDKMRDWYVPTSSVNLDNAFVNLDNAHRRDTHVANRLCSVLYQSIRGVVERELEHPSAQPLCPTRLLAELAYALFGRQGSRNVLSLLHRVHSSAIAMFSLRSYVQQTQYSQRLHQHATGKFGMTEADSLLAIYNHIEETAKGHLLDRVHNQSMEVPEAEAFFIPFSRGLAASIDEAPPQARGCVSALIEAYLSHKICPAPRKPDDWARPDEIQPVHGYYDTCGCVKKINAFLLDQDASSLEVFCERSRTFFVHDYRYLDVVRGDNNARTMTKTLRHWDEKNRAWDKQASKALAEIKTIPQQVLEQCLADRYDEIMGLHKYRISSDMPASSSDVLGGDEQQPAAGKKRKHDGVSPSPETSPAK